MLKLKSDKIITPKGVEKGYLYAENGKITAVTDKDLPCDKFYDLSGLYVSSGFIDLHTHGAGGYDFINSSPEAVTAGCRFHAAHGTTSLLPTVSAAPISVMEEAVAHIAAAKEAGNTGCNIVGAHLEGPYLSAAQCGAQRPDFITPPIKEDYLPLLQKYGKYIARWSYAPENDDGSFCHALREFGVLPSAGHTDAVYSDMVRASEGGCNLVTHLYSCTSTVTRNKGFRSLGVIESAFLLDDMFVEIIADGRHLPKELVQMIVKIKGRERVALITDSLAIAGTDVTEGITGGTAFIVEDGVCKLRDRSAFAGSIATADKLLAFMVKEAGFSVVDAVLMMTETPARILGINKGALAAGLDADITVFDDNFNIKSVFVAGDKVI